MIPILLVVSLVTIAGFGSPTTPVPTRELVEDREIEPPTEWQGGLFGESVAISGDTLVIGEPRSDTAADQSGEVFIYQRDLGGAGNWGLVRTFVSPDAQPVALVGDRVAIDGDTIVVGAFADDTMGENAGVAWVLERDLGGPDNWGVAKKLVASDAAPNDWFGSSCAIDGDTILVGASEVDNGNGAIYVFERNVGGADNWGEVQKLVHPLPGVNFEFGTALDIEGDLLVAGTPREQTEEGRAFVFERQEDTWVQVERLEPTDHGGRFGDAVAIDGDLIVVGAGEGFQGGVAYVFERSGPEPDWVAIQTMLPSDRYAHARFGGGIAIAGDYLAVSADGDLSGGAVFVFVRMPGGHYFEIAKMISSTTGGDLGRSVALEADGTVFAGAPTHDPEDTSSLYNSGTSFIFSAEVFLADSFESGDFSLWTNVVGGV